MRSTEREAIEAGIREAFARVQLGSGVSLRQFERLPKSRDPASDEHLFDA